jgi:hypothetical protein
MGLTIRIATAGIPLVGYAADLFLIAQQMLSCALSFRGQSRSHASGIEGVQRIFGISRRSF